jgi:hypothetical protein
VAASEGTETEAGEIVSTHSHPKVAASEGTETEAGEIVSTHSHPQVAAPCIKKQEKSAN